MDRLERGFEAYTFDAERAIYPRVTMVSAGCAADFQRRIGEVVAVQFVDPKRKKTKGMLLSVDETEIVLENESGRITEALADIEMARIVI